MTTRMSRGLGPHCTATSGVISGLQAMLVNEGLHRTLYPD